MQKITQGERDGDSVINGAGGRSRDGVGDGC
jgi:hypothetical protein